MTEATTTLTRAGRLLITGGSGLLALNWACAMRREWDVVLGTHAHAVRLEGVSAQPLNLENAGRLTRQFEDLAPDIVVHTAGLTNVDRCEDDPALARHVNAELARNVAEAAASRNVRLVHVSTDHLFAGTRSGYREDDTPEPLNEYARSKLLAEEWVKQADPRALVVRTNFFGWGSAIRRSFSDWIIDVLRSGREITLFEDAFFSPILIESLVEATMDLSAAGMTGIVNVVGDERVSKLEFGLRLARRFGLGDALIRRGRISRSFLQAPRPRDMSLSNGLASRSLGRSLGSLDGFFDSLARQEASGLAREIYNAVTE